MKTHREFLFGFLILIVSILACNFPGAISEAEETPATAAIIPTATEAVIAENTATSAPLATETPIPFTATAEVSPEIILDVNSNCRTGPNNRYNIIDQISAGKALPVIGRSEDNGWWQVVNATNRECWIFNENATPNTDFSSVKIGEAPPLPSIPQNFLVVDQLCQPGPKKFSVTLSWSSGGGEIAFRLFRDGNQLGELKASRLNYKDTNAPFNKNITYEIESINENGTSERAIQIVSACK